ncbi:MAG: DUF1559 domain-containing protein [Planctomycetaceae bacterium]|nr:DUF1559 domain-containing protein [Planctomycetaceae bacterium]
MPQPWYKMTKLEWAVVIGIALGLVAILLPAVRRARDTARRTQSRNNLKNLGLALYNYHDAYSVFPPGGTMMSDGQGHYGWFTRLKPFLEASPYYAMIDFDRAWDDRVNRHLFQITPMSARRPGVAEFATKDGFVLTHYSGNPSVLHRNSSVTVRNFQLGTNHGWILGEVVGNFEPWGSPFNWRDADDPLNRGIDSYGGWNGGAHFVMGDGSVRFVSNEITESVSEAFNGGLPTPSPESTDRPEYNWKYWTNNKVPPVESIPLDDLEWDGLVLTIFNHHDGVPRTAMIQSRGKGSLRNPRLEDLQRIVEECPDVRILFTRIDVDEHSSSLLTQLPQLNVLSASTVSVTPEVLANLKQMNHLEELIIGELDPDDRSELQSHLPGVLIDVKSEPRSIRSER